MQEEFEHLRQLLLNSDPLDVQGLDRILNESIKLFSKMQEVMVKGTNDEKTYLLRLVTLLNEKIQERFQRMLDKVGVSKEDFFSILSNPKNFPKEQWETMQQVKEQLEAKRKIIEKSIRKTEAFLKDPGLKKAMEAGINPPSSESTAKKLRRRAPKGPRIQP